VFIDIHRIVVIITIIVIINFIIIKIIIKLITKKCSDLTDAAAKMLHSVHCQNNGVIILVTISLYLVLRDGCLVVPTPNTCDHSSCCLSRSLKVIRNDIHE